jgi:hypothetical protein
LHVDVIAAYFTIGQEEMGMQFSYRISEAQFLRGMGLWLRLGRSRALKAVMFWVFILVCLLFLWMVVNRSIQMPEDSGNSQVASEQTMPANAGLSKKPDTAGAILSNVGPLVVLAGVWFFLVFRMYRAKRKLYRDNPAMQGEFTINVTPDEIDLSSTAGFSSKSKWSLYKFWREKDGIVLLVHHSQTFVLVSLDGLNEYERAEFRSILGAVVPKR